MKYFDLSDFYASLRWIWNNEVALFENDFARYIGAKYAIGTSFGRTALYLGLRSIDVRDKEVIVPAFICTVVRHAVEMAGAIPQFVDIALDNFNLNLNDLKRKITSKTKAIILTHYFGCVAKNIDEVTRLARENNLVLIEDCAHSLGAEYHGRKIGTFGDFSIFSLTKNMINFGGGVLATNDEDLYQKARSILQNEKNNIKSRIFDFPIVLAYGLEQAICKLIFDRVGQHKWWLMKVPRLFLNLRRSVVSTMKLPKRVISLERRKEPVSDVPEIGRVLHYPQDINMEPIIASLGRSQLKKINELIAKRKKIYDDLAKCVHHHFVNDAKNININNVYTHFVLQFENSNIFEIIEKCKNNGLSLRGTWPTRQRLRKTQDTDNVLKIKRENLIWAINPDLTTQEVDKFISIINSMNDHKSLPHLVQEVV